MSEKLKRILFAKGSFTSDEIDKMTESQGWAWVYANAQRRQPDNRIEICFTGLGDSEKERLSVCASEVGLKVVSGVTKKLVFLVAGKTAGPAKLEKARNQGVQIIDRDAFLRFAETGELT